jgi:hypothetical protein
VLEKEPWSEATAGGYPRRCEMFTVIARRSKA